MSARLQHPPTLRNPEPLRAIINGKTAIFKTPEEKFHALVAESLRLRAPGSSTDSFFNHAYGQIVAMGWSAVPLLLKESQRQRGHWFTALAWITGIEMVTPAMRGNLRQIRAAWTRWGIENGYITEDSQGQVVQG
jgi:hypothetical protein